MTALTLFNDWTPSSSYTAPTPEANTVAELIRDLTQASDLDRPELNADLTATSQLDPSRGSARRSEQTFEFESNLESPADATEAITLADLFADSVFESEGALESEGDTVTTSTPVPTDALTPADLFAESEPEHSDVAEREIEPSEALTRADLFAESELPEPEADWFAAFETSAVPDPDVIALPEDFEQSTQSAAPAIEFNASMLDDVEADADAQADAPSDELEVLAVSIEPDSDAEFLADAGIESPVSSDEISGEIIDVAEVEVAELASLAVPEIAPEIAPVEEIAAPPEPIQGAEALPRLLAELAPAPPVAGLDEALLAQLDELLADPPLPDPAPEASSAQWFLGIDIGTTGISAVLLNRQQYRLYPLYWQASTADFPARKQFRLATAVTLLTDEPKAFPLPTIRIDPTASSTLKTIASWKPYLRIAVPHYSPQTSRWEPALQWAAQQTLPLRTIQEVLQQLLETLNPDRAAFRPALTCGALGLEPAEFQTVLGQLEGIVVGYPTNWPDTYSFNVREAILQAELVQSPAQIVFVEEAIAALLSALPAADRRPIALAQTQGQSGHLHNADWQGVTLILTAGAIVTEMVLVNLPSQLQALNSTDFYTRSLPLAGCSLDQDIIGQMLYPALRTLLDSNRLDSTRVNRALEDSAEYAPDLILEQFDPNFGFTQLGLEPGDFPGAAELELAQRYRLQQQLGQTVSGQTLLNLAHALKIALQFQPRFVVQWGTARLVFDRPMLTSQVLLPYVQRLNRELNTLLAQTNTTAAAVKQVLCTGGTASLGAITRWLRQKLPNATIVQDTYPQPVSATHPCIPSCSRVAYGLATLPLHPQVIDQSRHQFSDYLLLTALLKAIPAQPTQVSTIMRLLEQQGIDTQTCRFRILALLEGHLPPGLIPADADLPLLAAESASNPDYQAIRLTPLLLKHADRTYEPNPHVWAYLQQYLNTLLADTEQTLEQPLPAALTAVSPSEQP